MDFYVVMGRKGNRVAKRKKCRRPVGVSHRISKEETQAWFVSKFEGILSNE